jgi:hypothetical protein
MDARRAKTFPLKFGAKLNCAANRFVASWGEAGEKPAWRLISPNYSV